MSAPDWEKLRAPFSADELERKPQPVTKNDQNKGRCENSTYSADGVFCGGWHARSVHLDYVGHAGITMRLNDVCGPDQWDWEPLSWTETGTPARSDGGMWIKLTIWDTTKIGFGDPGSSTGANAIKEVIGDALRNAAMRFGIGTYLWSKSERAMAAKSGELEPESEPVNRDPRAEAAGFLGVLHPELDAAGRARVAEAALGKPIPEASMADWARVLEKWQRDGVDIDRRVENVPLPDDPEPEEARGDGSRLITAPQNRALHAALTRMGIKGEAVHDWLSRELGITVTSAKRVTAEEASFLLDKLKQAGA